MSYCPTKQRVHVFILLFYSVGSVCAFNISWQHLPGAERGCVRMGTGRGRAWNDALQGSECEDLHVCGLCPTWVRAGTVGSLGCSITTLICDPAAGFAVRSALKQRILHLSPRTQGFASSVAGIPPSSFAGALGVCDFPHTKSTKLPCERCCSEVKRGRTHLLPAVCREMGNSAPWIIISLGKH